MKRRLRADEEDFVNVPSISASLIAMNAGFERAQARSAEAIGALLEAGESGAEGVQASLVESVLAVREAEVAVLAIAAVERANSENTKSLLDILA